jgi:hypothetical protein
MANVLQMMTNAVTGGDDIGDIVGQLDAAKAKGAAAYQEIERLEVQRLAAQRIMTLPRPSTIA